MAVSLYIDVGGLPYLKYCLCCGATPASMSTCYSLQAGDSSESYATKQYAIFRFDP